MTLTYLFLAGHKQLTSDIVNLIERSTIIFPPIHKTKTYIMYRQIKVPVVQSRVSIHDIVPIIHRYYSDLPIDQQLSQINQITNQINYGINVPAESPCHIPIYTKEYIDMKKWSAELPEDNYNSWISYMIDDQIIIGYYQGIVSTDRLDRPYNHRSCISIHPNYRGKGFCYNFVKETYYKVVQFYHVHYFHLLLASEQKTFACYCYAQASLTLGYKVYLDNTEITIKNDCDILQSNPLIVNMYIVVAGYLDNIMIET